MNKMILLKKTGIRITPCGSTRKIGLFKCFCGNVKEICISNVKRGITKSCGCINKEQIRKLGKMTGKDKSSYSHGFFGTRFYRACFSAKSRCENKNSTSYKFYGAKGIKFKYKNFLEFKKDLYKSYLAHIKKYGEKQTTLERIDYKGHYEKGNCTWATYTEQANNRKDNTKLIFNGQQKTLAEWERITGISRFLLKKQKDLSKIPILEEVEQ